MSFSVQTYEYIYSTVSAVIIVTGFWKIIHMVSPETIRIFVFTMALLVIDTTFKNISKLYL